MRAPIKTLAVVAVLAIAGSGAFAVAAKKKGGKQLPRGPYPSLGACQVFPKSTAPAGDARKIGSIGIHVRRGITTHGLAVNVAKDLQPFEWVVPCGIEACRMTSLTRELGAEQSIDEFATALAARLGEAYDREPVEAPPG